MTRLTDTPAAYRGTWSPLVKASLTVDDWRIVYVTCFFDAAEVGNVAGGALTSLIRCRASRID